MEDFDEFFGFGKERRNGFGGKVLFHGDDFEPHAGFDEFFEGDVHFVGEVFAGFGDAGFGVIGGDGGGGTEELVADVGGACFRREGFANGNRARGEGGNAGFEVEGSGHGVIRFWFGLVDWFWRAGGWGEYRGAGELSTNFKCPQISI